MFSSPFFAMISFAVILSFGKTIRVLVPYQKVTSCPEDILLFHVFSLLSLYSVQSTRASGDTIPPELNAYIELADDTCHWEIVESRADHPMKSWLVELTSQTWHDIPWKHFMIVVEPQELKYPDCSILFITGGRIGRKPSDSSSQSKKKLKKLVETSPRFFW